MDRPQSSQRRAPIDFIEVRGAFHAVRAAGAFAVAAISVVAIASGDGPAIYRATGAAIVFIDAVVRRIRRDESPFVPLLLDTTILGLGLSIRGIYPATEAAALAYLIVAALLLLPLRRAVTTLAYVGLWSAAVALIAPITTIEPAVRRAALWIDRLVMAALLLAVIAIIAAATGALTKVHRRFESAIETERRAAELKNEFVSMVSHELRTPLTSMSGFTAMLIESWKALEPSEVDEFLTIMAAENERLSRIVEDILVIPRLEAGRLPLHPEVFDLREESYRIFEQLFPAEGGKETFLVIPGGVAVYCDKMRFGQIIRNLLDNASKYGGDQILIEGERRGDFFEIVVADNGPGIPPEQQALIFEHFEQLSKGDSRDSQGIGLGLPIARKLSRAMGGDLWYESRFPTGSKFCFTVALAADQPKVAPAAQSITDPSPIA